MRATPKPPNGFTLMELLVVVAIIAILMGLMLPAVHRARESARRTKAKAEVHQIATAWKSYFNDYRSFPDTGNSEMDNDAISNLDGTGGDNPRHFRYMEFPQSVYDEQPDSARRFRDPWERPYWYALSPTYSVSPPGTNIARAVVAWSVGRDPDESDDDIGSWGGH